MYYATRLLLNLCRCVAYHGDLVDELDLVNESTMIIGVEF
jgi:hypothetical protein